MVVRYFKVTSEHLAEVYYAAYDVLSVKETAYSDFNSQFKLTIQEVDQSDIPLDEVIVNAGLEFEDAHEKLANN